MEFTAKSSPDDVFLAPRDYAGYVILMNSAGNGEKNNCKSLRAIIKGHPRVIVYSSTRIRPG